MGTAQGSVEEGLEGMVQQGEDKGSGPFVENARTRCLSFKNENFLGAFGCLPTQGKQEFYHKVPATRRGVRKKFCLLGWDGNSPRSYKKWTLSGHSRSILHSRGSACRMLVTFPPPTIVAHPARLSKMPLWALGDLLVLSHEESSSRGDEHCLLRHHISLKRNALLIATHLSLCLDTAFWVLSTLLVSI